MAVLLSACGEGDPAAPSSRSAVLDFAAQAQTAGRLDQYRILRDGTVTRSEYETQIDVAVSCNRERERETYPTWVNPVDGLTILTDFLPGQGIPLAESAAGEDCETVHTVFVEAAYLASHEAVMAEALRASVANCSAAAGVQLTGAEVNLTQLVRAAGEARKQVVLTCVDEGLRSIYPDQPIYFVSY